MTKCRVRNSQAGVTHRVLAWLPRRMARVLPWRGRTGRASQGNQEGDACASPLNTVAMACGWGWEGCFLRRLWAHTGMRKQVPGPSNLGTVCFLSSLEPGLQPLVGHLVRGSQQKRPLLTWLSNYGVLKWLWDAWGSRGCPSGVRGTKALLVPSSRLCKEQQFLGSPGRLEQAARREGNLLCKEPWTREGCTFLCSCVLPSLYPPTCSHPPAAAGPDARLLSIPPSSSWGQGLWDQSCFY